MEGGWLFYSWLCLLLSDMSFGCVSHFFQGASFSPFCPFLQPWFSTLLSWILTFLCLWEKSFSGKMIMEPLLGYWAWIGSSSDHFIVFNCGMLAFGRS